MRNSDPCMQSFQGVVNQATLFRMMMNLGRGQVLS